MKFIYVTEVTEVEPIDLTHDALSSIGSIIDASIANTIKHKRKMREERPEMTPDRMKSITVEFESQDLPYLSQTY